MIAADWACPLMFARAGVHNVHTWRGRSSTQRVRHTVASAKVDKEVIVVAQGDMAICMLTEHLE